MEKRDKIIQMVVERRETLYNLMRNKDVVCHDCEFYDYSTRVWLLRDEIKTLDSILKFLGYVEPVPKIQIALDIDKVV